MRKRYRLLGTVALLLISVAFAACGGPGPGAADEPGVASRAEPPKATAALPAVPTETPAPPTADSGQTAPPATETQEPQQPDEQTPAPAPIAVARTVEEVESIQTYRMIAGVTQVEGSRGASSVEADGVYAKNPPAEQLTVQIREGDRPAVVMEIRLVDGVRYLGMDDNWAVTGQFDLAESTVATPAQFTQAVAAFQQIGREELHGRPVIHLQGEKETLPTVQSGSDSIDFSRMDVAVVDIWIDEAEQFIVKMTLHGEIGPDSSFDVLYEYLDFNQPVTVTVPDAIAQAAPTATPDPNQISALLGFPFPLPEGAVVNIFGRTAAIVTTLPLAEARELVAGTLAGNGFEQVSVAERATNEFFYTFSNGERTITALVFTNDSGGTSINIGAAK